MNTKTSFSLAARKFQRAAILCGFVVVVTSLLAIPQVARAQASTAERMQKVLRQFVVDFNCQIAGNGSWLTSVGKYVDPLKVPPGVTPSDHDMRLVLSGSPNPFESAEQWKRAQNGLRDLIRKEFGADANRVLSRTNLYAPSQLMAGVENEADALTRYVRYQSVPNLGFSGSVTPNIPKEAYEGVYGQGAKAGVQAAEAAKGKLFYSAGGKAVSTSCNLLHLEEGMVKQTVGSSSQLAQQWIAHVDDALREGSAKDVAKQLARVEQSLTKARELAKLGPDEAFRAEIRSLVEQVKGNPGSLGSLEARIQQLMQRGRVEAALLGRMENAATSSEQAVLRELLHSLEKKSDLAEKLMSLSGTALERSLQALCAYFVARELNQASIDKDPEKYFSGLAGLGPADVAILVALTKLTLDSSRELGSMMSARTQEAWDLVAGVFSAGGRADATAREYSLEQLVERCHNEEQLKSFVYARSVEASQRGLKSDASKEADAGVAQTIFDRCYPAILRGWLARRAQMLFEFNKLAGEMRSTLLTLEAAPDPTVLDPAAGKVDVKVSVANWPHERRLARMRTIVRTLTGQSPAVTYYHTWTKNAFGLDGKYSFSKVGTHQVDLKLTVAIGTTNISRDSPLNRTEIELKSNIVVNVELPVGPVDLAGRWSGSLTIQEMPALEGYKPSAGSSSKDPLAEGCGLPAEALVKLKELKGKPLHMTLTLKPKDAASGTAQLQIIPPETSGMKAADPTSMSYRYSQGKLSIDHANQSGAVIHLEGGFSPAKPSGFTVSGTFVIQVGEAGKTKQLFAKGTWTGTNPQAE